MAGIFSQGGSAGHRYAGWLSEVEAKNFIFGGKVFNGSPSAIYVGSNLVWVASPYSKAATAVLKATFPTQWAIIKDYGLAHPEIVPYMNAYATEDAKIAYSLVEGIGRRYCVSAGQGNYADLGYAPSLDMYLRLIINNDRTGDNRFLDTRNTYSDNSEYGFYIYTNNKIRFCFGGYMDKYITVPANEPMILEIDKDYAKINGTSYASPSGTRNTTTNNYCAFALHQSNGTYTYNKENKISEIYMSRPNEEHWHVPFKRNGQMELLDLVSGNLATRVGTFTELIQTPSTP